MFFNCGSNWKTVRCCLIVPLVMVAINCSFRGSSVNTVDNEMSWIIKMNVLPEVGDMHPIKCDTCFRVMIITGITGILQRCVISVDEVEFDLGICPKIRPDNCPKNRILYMETTDISFRTPEGVGVGMTMGEIKKRSNTELIEEPGWAFYMGFPSGWNAAFVVGYTATESEPTDKTPVAFVFRRNR